MFSEHIELESQTVKLIPLSLEHEQALQEATSDGELWNIWFASVPQPSQIKAYIETALAEKAKGTSFPFAVVEKATNTVIGTTRLYQADALNKRLGLGYTWYATSYQRTSVNTECKLLLLSYAFEQLNVICVQFFTHWHNQRSRNAIARLGAKQDGILRNHQILANGTYRDTVVFSIIDTEWSTVKCSLEYRLQRV